MRRDGGAAFAATDAQGIERGLLELFSKSHAERHHMGEAGRRLVEKRFTWASVAREMVSVYHWTLGGGAPPPCVTEYLP